jgi:hypothetical protein
MIFRIRDDGPLERYSSAWVPKEIDLERYLLPGDDEEPLLEQAVFREPLLLISHQVRTRDSKRADILALDQAGCAVIIELKRHWGSLGVDTQALQYLASFSVYRGRDFIAQFAKKDNLTERIEGFLGNDFRLEDLNRRSRIILIARSFDPTLFSMGEWLARSGVAFRCVEYTPFEVSADKFLSFSVAFDRAPEPLYPVAFRAVAREPATFWHNIGRPDGEWWQTLKQRGEICASFENQTNDAGEQLLRSYVAGDRIVAYAKGRGAVGWGLIEHPNSYRLLEIGDPGDTFPNHLQRHRLNVSWKAVAPTIDEGIRPDKIREEFDIYHPVSTSAKIAPRKAEALIKALSGRFGAA